ncbi:unnamed protein product [Rotaria magnacalcarata]|uniref:Uncharacterized protein n=1 Tax=Rotaria magnacalcarata TaxID=392030 RepID=A0A8S3EFW6_9BILA|nr:unnamed protein product [Rotaria magnacalcarata]CAF5181862.1 unnamed protein product [Rotaria magnacalcarata]
MNEYQPRKRSKANQSLNPPARPAATASSSSSPPSSTILTTIPLQSSIIMKDQPQTPPPYLSQPSSSSASSSPGSNPNDPISRLVATLFDQKLAMFASNFQQFNIDQLQYHFTPPNAQIYPTSTSTPFDPIIFLAKQQEHRLV